MRNLLFFILIVLFSQNLKADLGRCLLYEAKFYMKDGSLFNGSIEVGGEGEMSYLNENGINKYCSDEGMMKLVKALQGKQNTFLSRDGGIQSTNDFDKLTVYKGFREIIMNPMKSFKKPKYYDKVLGFVDQNDIVFIDSADIEKIVFWKAKYVKRSWIYYELITAPKDMIETVEHKQYWNKLTIGTVLGTDSLYFSDQLIEWGIEMINYNSKVNTSELKRLAHQKLKVFFNSENLNKEIDKICKMDEHQEDFNRRRRLRAECRERYFQDIREWFWERGIVIVQTWGTC